MECVHLPETEKSVTREPQEHQDFRVLPAMLDSPACQVLKVSLVFLEDLVFKVKRVSLDVTAPMDQQVRKEVWVSLSFLRQ